MCYTTTIPYTQTTNTNDIEVYLTINKNRIKSYNDSYYLSDNTEFELEIINNGPDQYALDISINKQSQNKRLIINGKSRIYLERYLDTNNKFIFRTYNVDDNEEVKKIIESNGIVEIRCHRALYTKWHMPLSPSLIWNTTVMTGSLYIQPSYCSTTTNTVVNNSSLETGRILKGDESDQSLINTYGVEYDPIATQYILFKIKPKSQFKTQTHNVRLYCTDCGSKIKTQYKYCPLCGKKQ